jgi:hypothetical protein
MALRSMTIYERRRAAVALVITVLALPALWLAKRDNPMSQPGVAAVDMAQGLEASGAQPANHARPATPPGYLTGSAEEYAPLIAEPSGPPIDETFTRAGFASYRNFAAQSDRLCDVNFLPPGTRITVENTDNGKRIDCVANRVRLGDGIIVVLDSSLFSALADLSDAPIPVRIRW